LSVWFYAISFYSLKFNIGNELLSSYKYLTYIIFIRSRRL